MRADLDFESYAAARWHLVIRTLVLLGVPPGHAASLTRQALVRRHPEWSHQDGFDDLDAELYREVLDLKHHDDGAWWSEPAYDDEQWIELEPQLDRLSPAQREWLVLRHVAELPESYIAAVVGEPDPGGRTGLPTGEQLREVARLIPVPPPDLEQVIEAAAQRHRSRRRRGFAVAAALLAAAGVVSLVVAVTADSEETDPTPRELDPAPVVRATSGPAVAWYSDGRLHLHDVVLDLPDLRTVATINNGAVYADDAGDLVQVDDQGERTVLDTIGDDGTFEASDKEGLVAWLPEDDDAELVVRDLAARTDVARVPVVGAGRVIAIDTGSVFFHDDAGDHMITIPGGEVEPEGRSDLIDVSLRVRLYQETPRTVRVIQPLVDLSYSWPGERGQLSENAQFALTWVGGRITLHDTRSGDPVTPHVRLDESVLDAEFGPDNTITYLVMKRSSDSGIVTIRSCSLGTVYLPSGEAAPTCTEEVAGQFRGVDTDVQLAR